jgi:hypothetical protein
MAAGGGAGSSGGGGRVARLAGGRLPLNGRHAHELATAETSRLNSQYGASSTGACREPGDGPVDNTECGSVEGMDSTWRGADSRGPSECSPPRAAWSRDGARGPDSEAVVALAPARATRDVVARHRPAQRVTERRFERLDLQKVE